mmetsp:Transcript_57778/g.137550  ORF Transcript_57778/g.137550 Transcript_57778/m.137550 type:complete len:376 (+) Transcript_57778:80-1207(+)
MHTKMLKAVPSAIRRSPGRVSRIHSANAIDGQTLQLLPPVTLHRPPDCIGVTDVLGIRSAEAGRQVLEQSTPSRWAANHKMLLTLPDHKRVPELVKIEELLLKWQERALWARSQDMPTFTTAVRDTLKEGEVLVKLAATGIAQLGEHGEYDGWMDEFLLRRMGTRILLQQFLALRNSSAQTDARPVEATGLVDVDCNAVDVCKKVAECAQDLTFRLNGKTPRIEVKAFSGLVEHGAEEVGVCNFPCIPNQLEYLLLELLKNSCSATLSAAADDRDLFERVIRIVITSDDEHAQIKVSDQAHGIPASAYRSLYSWTMGAAARRDDKIKATPLGGYGVGLPLSRLHAWQLGGDLNIWSYPGIGTDAVVRIKRASWGE